MILLLHLITANNIVRIYTQWLANMWSDRPSLQFEAGGSRRHIQSYQRPSLASSLIHIAFECFACMPVCGSGSATHQHATETRFGFTLDGWRWALDNQFWAKRGLLYREECTIGWYLYFDPHPLKQRWRNAKCTPSRLSK